VNIEKHLAEVLNVLEARTYQLITVIFFNDVVNKLITIASNNNCLITILSLFVIFIDGLKSKLEVVSSCQTATNKMISINQFKNSCQPNSLQTDMCHQDE
jgi:hypothetical protein